MLFVEVGFQSFLPLFFTLGLSLENGCLLLQTGYSLQG